MYIRRKVFSLGEGNIDYDYNTYQQLYSEAFQDGVNYAIEKLFSRKYINPKNITRVRRNSINSVDNSGKGFYEKVKSMQPKTNTIADIDAIPLARLKNL